MSWILIISALLGELSDPNSPSNSIPELSAIALLGLGLVGIAFHVENIEQIKKHKRISRRNYFSLV